MSIFETAKTVPALEVAERYAGVRPTIKGRRAWCSCPFHQDNNPSLSFDLEGRYAGQYICSSGKHDPSTRNGSSVSFVAAWFKESAYDAARRICDDFNLQYEKIDPKEAAARHHRKAEIDRLSGEIREAAAFAVSVCLGLVRWCEDRKAETEDPNEISAYDAIIKDANEFREALATPSDESVKHAILTGEGVKEKIECLFNMLRRSDEENGTDYIRFYRRGEL